MSGSGPARTESAGPAGGGSASSAGGDGAASAPGVRDLLGRLAASFASLIDTRAQLAALEFAEERERARDRLVLVLVAALAGGFALLGANALVVVLLWEGLGWGALLLPTLAWTAIAGLAAWRLSVTSRRSQPPFAATLAELERDRAFLAERYGKRPG